MAAKAATKSEILAGIATTTELSRKQVASVFDALSDVIKNNVGKKGPGLFVVPGLMKIIVVNKPATKAHFTPSFFRATGTTSMKNISANWPQFIVSVMYLNPLSFKNTEQYDQYIANGIVPNIAITTYIAKSRSFINVRLRNPSASTTDIFWSFAFGGVFGNANAASAATSAVPAPQ